MAGEEMSGGKERPGRGLTPEQRRFMNPSKRMPTPRTERVARDAVPTAERQSGRVLELQYAILALGFLLLLGLTFFVGTKYSYLKYLLANRSNPAMKEKIADRFPGVAPDDLVREALLSERKGNWKDAVTRYMAAKQKDLSYRGILYRVGSILYTHHDLDAADKAFERSINFGENIELANFYRGLIATRKRELDAAEQYFQAAATAAPFVADYEYYCGEAYRLDLKPRSAISHYERAALLAPKQQDDAVCRFKIRMARIEAAEGSVVSKELEKVKAAGPLSADWLMTSAALQLRESHLDAAREEIETARQRKAPGVFASCANDIYFKEAARKFPELAQVLHLDLNLQVPFP